MTPTSELKRPRCPHGRLPSSGPRRARCPIDRCACCRSRFGYIDCVSGGDGYQIVGSHQPKNRCDSCGGSYEVRVEWCNPITQKWEMAPLEFCIQLVHQGYLDGTRGLRNEVAHDTNK